MQDTNGIWAEFTTTRSDSLRNALIEKYLPIVRYSAERIHAKLPDEVELDDLISVGVFGLMDAIAAFEPERGIKFETYCAPRIRGAILDELRSMDWVPRLVPVRAPTSSPPPAGNWRRSWGGRPPTKKWPGGSVSPPPNTIAWPRTPTPSAWFPCRASSSKAKAART